MYALEIPLKPVFLNGFEKFHQNLDFIVLKGWEIRDAK